MPAERHQRQSRPRGGSTRGGSTRGGSTRGGGPNRGSYKKPKPTANAQAGPSTAIPGDGERRHTVPSLEERDGLMGVSKLKSQIRQTRRLLGKDTLEPGLRVATQRRLTSLEADLAKAEKRTVEKKNGAKYHAVKFFERQKLVRVIRRCVRDLGAEDDEDKDGKALAKELHDARVMLNYIVHFPNTQKYIALFPPETKDAAALTLPAYLDTEAAEGPAATRRDILREMARLMAEGKIGAEPEKENERERAPQDRRGVAFGGVGVEVEVGKKKEKDEAKEDEEEDDFFGDE